MNNLSKTFVLSEPVSTALRTRRPLVALESTVITHGLPNPRNVELAQDMELQVAEHGATPATVAVLDGKIRVGLSDRQLTELANSVDPIKVSLRDFSSAIVSGRAGGTTVAGTSYVASKIGIRVFATGGIGGVHREPALDISPDLTALGRTPIIVVCAGAKAILDLPGTLEVLETLGVPVIGFGTDEFPAFYSTSSGLPVSQRLDSAKAIAAYSRQHWSLGFESAVLVTVPPPEEHALDNDFVNMAIEQALSEARAANIRGQAISPFLLSRVSELTGQASLDTNLVLLLNNAAVAAQISVEMSRGVARAV